MSSQFQNQQVRPAKDEKLHSVITLYILLFSWRLSTFCALSELFSSVTFRSKCQLCTCDLISSNSKTAMIFAEHVHMRMNLFDFIRHIDFPLLPADLAPLLAKKWKSSFPVKYLYDGDNEHYLNGAISLRLGSRYQYEPPLCYSQYGIQTSLCHRALGIKLRERYRIMQKIYNAIHRSLMRFGWGLFGNAKCFYWLIKILGSVRKLLGWSTMAAYTESSRLNKNESAAVWMPAERLRRCDLIWSVNPWTARSCQYSALVWSGVY